MKNTIAAAAICSTLALSALALSACASTVESELLATKSPTQLLRNEAANRLMTGTDESVAAQQDYSAACRSEAEDPEGLYRSWRSTLLAEVPEESAIGVDQFVGALATSFSEDGWVFTEAHDGAAGKVTTMTRTDSIVTMTFTASENTGEGASVYIEAIGPCVLTGGPESDEVTQLEK
jgi:hypothetical protein